MSRSSWLDIDYSRPILPTAMIAALREHGWQVAPRFWYLPLHDGDDFAWQEVAVDRWDEIDAMFQEKERAGEYVGLTLGWQNSEIQCSFLLRDMDIQVGFSWYPNRHLAGLTEQFTDISWYLERLLPPVLKLNHDDIVKMVWRWQ